MNTSILAAIRDEVNGRPDLGLLGCPGVSFLPGTNGYWAEKVYPMVYAVKPSFSAHDLAGLLVSILPDQKPLKRSHSKPESYSFHYGVFGTGADREDGLKFGCLWYEDVIGFETRTGHHTVEITDPDAIGGARVVLDEDLTREAIPRRRGVGLTVYPDLDTAQRVMNEYEKRINNRFRDSRDIKPIGASWILDRDVPSLNRLREAPYAA